MTTDQEEAMNHVYLNYMVYNKSTNSYFDIFLLFYLQIIDKNIYIISLYFFMNQF